MASLSAAALMFASATCLTAAGVAAEQQRPPEQVQQDLEAAMKGEAFAYAKYMLFAEEARAHGRPDLATLFENTARTERMEHFREHAKLAGLLGASDADNLRDAIKGETYETTRMYPEMAARARQVGDEKAAARFSEVGKDEAKHRDAFAAELVKLNEAPAKAAGGRM